MTGRILSLCERQGFLKQSNTMLQIGPVGHLLLHNLKNEWFYNVVINKDYNVLLSESSGFKDSLDFVKNLSSQKLPFGIAELSQTDQSTEFNDLVLATNNNVNLKCSMFVASTVSTQLFHQWQRQRRIWWRKFSPNPGRYFLTDIKTNENNVQSVEIMAKYPWNDQLLESLVVNPQPVEIESQEQFKEGRKSVQCHKVVSSINLNAMYLNTICDAFDDSEYKEIQRTLLRFHRKLAPYKISLAVSSSDGKASELNDLALHITRQLRTNHVSTLLLPNCAKLALDLQWNQYDEMGVPYNVLLNDKTLKDGIVLLRSRDTTLKEEVHVSELVYYVNQLFQNY